jgi:hypothetical protein
MNAVQAPSELLVKAAALTAVSDVPGKRDWHALEAKAVALLLDVEPVIGLRTSQVTQRQFQYGRNTVQKIGIVEISKLILRSTRAGHSLFPEEGV